MTAINATYAILLAISIITLISAAITEPGIIPRNQDQPFDYLP